MPNYIIEDDINFYNELKKSFDNDNDNENNNDDNDSNNKCLISNEILDSNHITLPCKHSFNYSPLYNDVYKQKFTFNHLEYKKLKENQMKCPYCRNVTNHILPYISNVPDIKKVRGVNMPLKWGLYPYTCKYTFKSGKKKNTSCDKKCVQEYCQSHLKYKKKQNENENENEHEHEHENENKTQNENEIHNDKTCISIIKYGKNKGNQCGCSNLYDNSQFCKRHWNLQNKKK